MTTANDVLKVARSQIGYCESPRNSNRTKYGKAFGVNGDSWCAIFCWWCGWIADKKRTLTIAKNSSAAYIQESTVALGGKWIMKKTRSRDTRKDYLKKARQGDIVSFDFGAFDCVRDHVGLLDRVEGMYAVCIEGNTSKKGSQSNGGMVCEQRRHYTEICSAVRPKYTGKPEPLEPLEVDGIMGYETISRLQRFLKVTEDGEIGPITTKAWQKKIGMTKKEQDGEWGTKTTKALQKYLTDVGFPVMVNGKKDKATIKALQRMLNQTVKK